MIRCTFSYNGCRCTLDYMHVTSHSFEERETRRAGGEMICNNYGLSSRGESKLDRIVIAIEERQQATVQLEREITMATLLVMLSFRLWR